MQAFTVISGVVIEGIPVVEFALSNGITVPAVTLGEKGRGRTLAVIPVKGDLAVTGETCAHFELDKTRRGKPALRASSPRGYNAIVAFQTLIGFRGGNSHTLSGGATVIAKGSIAQGIAGRMGGGEQILVKMEPGSSVIIKRFGRLYGKPGTHVCRWNGETLTSLTPEEEDLLP